MNYIFLFFIPGAAGNFLGRCLNLLPNTYTRMGHMPGHFFPESVTIKEKLEILGYESEQSRNLSNFRKRNWMHFENRSSEYTKQIEHNKLPLGYTLVLIDHPWKKVTNYNFEILPGSSDNYTVFYVNHEDNGEWCQLNAIYKSSDNRNVLEDDLIGYERIKKYSKSIPISLFNIVNREETFLKEIHKICNLSKLSLTSDIEEALKTLYHQWKTTTLTEEKFEEFKKIINEQK